MYNILTMKRVNFHLTGKQISELKLLSKQNGLPVAELIRRAVDYFLKAQRRGKNEPALNAKMDLE